MTAPQDPSAVGPLDPQPHSWEAAATMSLLSTLNRDALGSDYPQHRTAAGDRPPTSVAARIRTGVVVAVLGLILAGALVHASGAGPVRSADRTALVERVTAAAAATDAREADVIRLRAEVAAAESAALSADGAGRTQAERLARLELAVGLVAMQGPGLEVVLADATQPRSADDLGRVLDRDLQAVANGLWQAGAAAIAINGQRLTARSAIRSAGAAILVGYRPLLPPYRVSAIGDPATLESRFGRGSGGATLRALVDAYGVQVTISAASQVTVPAAAADLIRRPGADRGD